MFKLDPKLEQDSIHITTLNSCQVLLKKNEEIPWIILVPQIPNLVEILDLNDLQYTQVMDEVKYCASIMKKVFSPEKLNVAALGNIVSQLHFHIICRYHNDRAWPNPIWGTKSTTHNKSDEELKLQKILLQLNKKIL